MHQRAQTHLALLPSFSTFLHGLTQLQRDFSAKASSHIGSFRLSVARSAAERGGDGASLERALAGVLEQCDLEARELGECAERVHRDVAARLDEVGRRMGDVHKRHHSFYGKLMSQRDKAYDQRDRSRSAYFSACDSLESARQKKAGAKEGRDSDKAQRAYDAAHDDMLLAKDQYLLDLDAANVAKRRVYEVHLPALHDEFQLLEASAVRQLEGLIARMVTLQQESSERTRACIQKAQDALQLVDVEADQQAFVDAHSRTLTAAYEHPPDLAFEESPVWHDSDEFDTGPTAIVYLQNVKAKAETRLGDVSPAIESKRREVQGLKTLVDAYGRDPALGDTVGVVENLFNVSHETTLLELQQSELRASVELIDATLGGASPLSLLSVSFLSPLTSPRPPAQTPPRPVSAPTTSSPRPSSPPRPAPSASPASGAKACRAKSAPWPSTQSASSRSPRGVRPGRARASCAPSPRRRVGRRRSGRVGRGCRARRASRGRRALLQVRTFWREPAHDER